MSLFVSTKKRSKEIEIMDDFSMEGEELLKTLDLLAKINHYLGGNQVTLSGLQFFLKDRDKSKEIKIIDLGCGNGDMLRLVADYGKKHGFQFKLIGVDANQETINYAKKLSSNYANISYEKVDVFSDEFKAMDYDLALATLFLHHFQDNDLIKLLKTVTKQAKIGVIANDLQRSKIAYYLYKALNLFINNRMIKEDGLTSILRGFKRNDLINYSTHLQCESKISWKWAFRYQWLLIK